MAIQRDKPYPGMNFLVDLGTGSTDGPEAGLAEVIFPEARLEVTEYRNGNEKENNSRLIQTVTKYGNLILRRAPIGSLGWYDWWDAARNGGIVPRTIIVSLQNEDHTAVVLTWKFFRATPVNYQFSSLNGMGMEPLTESLELNFERLEME